MTADLTQRIAAVHDEIAAELDSQGYINRFIFRAESSESPGVLAELELFRNEDDYRSDDGDESEHVFRECDLAVPRRASLIGQMGAGKSFVLRKAFLIAVEQQRAVKNGIRPLFLDLNSDLASNLDIAAGFETRYGVRFQDIAADSPNGLMLFLDSLDERVLSDSQRFVTDLRLFLTQHDSVLSGVLIACRRSIVVTHAFTNVDRPFETFHVDHLSRFEFAQLLPADEIRTDFHKRCADLGINELLSSPFDGFYLARRFAAGESLPRTRRDCIDLRINDALVANPSEQRRAEAPSAARLRFIARSLSLISTFTSLSSWTHREALNHLSSKAVNELGRVTPNELEILFRTPLFRHSGGRIGFHHQIFREFLAAESLSKITSRKKRQLLQTSFGGSIRVATPYRGVASHLASLDAEFFRSLSAHDPLIAFFAEPAGSGVVDHEAIIFKVIQQSVDERRHPYWRIPPHGDYLISQIERVRPANCGRFIKSLLEQDSYYSRLWAACCADNWGVSEPLTARLCDIALDDDEHSDTRRWAVETISKCSNESMLRRLFPLIDCKNDSLRGLAIGVWRRLIKPIPSQYFVCLKGGRNENSVSDLQYEIQHFTEELDCRDLEVAFQDVFDSFSQLGDLGGDVLAGLIRRCEDCQFDIVPTEVLVLCVEGRQECDITVRRALRKYFRRFPRSLERVWRELLDRVSSGRCQRRDHVCSNVVYLAEDGIVQLIAHSKEYTNAQNGFIQEVVSCSYRMDGNVDRWRKYQRQIPEFVQDAWVSAEVDAAGSGDVMHQKQILYAALQYESSSADAIVEFIRAAVALYRGAARFRMHKEDKDDVSSVLRRQSTHSQRVIINRLRDHVIESHPKRIDHPNGEFEMPCDKICVAFWVLVDNVDLPTETIAEFAVAFAFGWCTVVDEQRWRSMLDQLRNRDQGEWRSTLQTIVRERRKHIAPALEILTAKDDLCAQDLCRKRLCEASFDESDIHAAVEYWAQICPHDFTEVLRSCYGTITENGFAKSKSHFDFPGWCSVLFALMAADEDWAWHEFETRLCSGDVPDSITIDRFTPFRPEQLRKRIPILGEWYRSRLVDPSHKDRMHDSVDAVQLLLISMEAVEAIDEIRRIRDTLPEHCKAAATSALQDAEDKLLEVTDPSTEPCDLLDFVLSDSYAMIRSDRDLLEAVSEALEQIRREIKRGEGTDAFWNGDEPKSEPRCQNVLLPRLRDKLAQFGVTTVEERFIGPNKVDFWVELPRKSAEPFRVCIEVKVARSGYGKAKLIRPIETQLYEQYLKPVNAHFGIYVAFWFRDSSRYDFPKTWQNASDFIRAVCKECRRVEEAYAVTLRDFVIDVTSDVRLH